MRRSVAPLLFGWLLLTGCSTVIAGQAAPADHNGPVPVRDAGLRRALLDTDTINSIMDASDMEVRDTRTELLDDDTSFDHACLAPWYPIQRSVYADSGWSALRSQLVRGGDVHGPKDHAVVEAVVGFPARGDAADFFEKQTDDWASCSDRPFTSQDVRGQGTEWEFGAVENADSTLSMTQTQLHTNGWSCQHALRVSNNVIIDVLACKMHGADEATAIVDEIDAKLPSV